ncbi:hypothetical protein EJB05_16652, partial [Eragrostis curvula]
PTATPASADPRRSSNDDPPALRRPSAPPSAAAAGRPPPATPSSGRRRSFPAARPQSEPSPSPAVSSRRPLLLPFEVFQDRSYRFCLPASVVDRYGCLMIRIT